MKWWRLKCVILQNASSPRVLNRIRRSFNTMVSYIVTYRMSRGSTQIVATGLVTSVMTSSSHNISVESLQESGQLSLKVTLWMTSHDWTTSYPWLSVSVYGCCYVSYLHCIIVSFQLLVALVKSYLILFVGVGGRHIFWQKMLFFTYFIKIRPHRTTKIWGRYPIP